MIESNNILPMCSDFDQIKKLEEDGQEYWTSRELCNALGYSTYQKFTRILNKAIAVANGKGLKTVDHFNQTVKWLSWVLAHSARWRICTCLAWRV